ncbi:pyrroloquinoline quinone biosynthesis protein PqqB [Duganella sp. FT92W]|uniref:Coenzyme PQQ synthesis protein B n=1 Tax=Pseudoduganella rivuli TaxID=2666085 RepID=A0A7X2INN8_9BURK|nr:pyrroloquinoline quinone biosynthesis protein PqqB [Pseudoduganella rivuli]MRV73194.1 pyrroloquinoline quinone biosynthesis protein PqqB [Pseudoduganella rivuli]
MKILVLGSSAGGGYPQWNCNCRQCDGVRRGAINSRARTQSSIAISVDGKDWLLVNASPDILTQLRASPALQPARAARDSGIAAVLLMDAQVDHVTGLMMLREGKRLPLYCSAAVHGDLTSGLPLLNVLSHYCGVDWHDIPVAAGERHSFTVPQLNGVRFTAVPLHSNAPPYSPRRDCPAPGDNIGLLVHDLVSGKRLFYAPGLGRIDALAYQAMSEADCLLVDGTFWTEDEMIVHGFSSKPAAAMGHLPQSGEGGMLEVLAGLPGPSNSAGRRKILIHINNTNPILDEDSPQRGVLRAQGVEVAYDGMEILL